MNPASQLPPQRPVDRPGWRLALAAAASAACGQALAQEALPPGRTVSLTPVVEMEGGYLETRGRIDDGNGRELVLRVSPGILFNSRSGRLQGRFSYTPSLIERRGNAATAGGEVQHSLNSALVAEVIPNWGYVDLNGTLSQQATSPFAQQTAEGSLQRNDDRTLVATGSVTPHAQGQIGGEARYELSGSIGQTRSKAVPGVDSKYMSASAIVQSAGIGRPLDWSLRIFGDHTVYAQQNAVDTRRAIADVSARPVPELRLTLRGGRETAAEGGASSAQPTTSYGAGLLWGPSQRTSLSIDADRRYFGHSGSASFSHRMPRAIVSYSFRRDVTRSADALAFTPPVTLYQLLFDQQASVEPDPIARDTLVRDTLAKDGLDPNQTVQFGYVTSVLSLRQLHTLALTWLGQRLTLTVQATADSTGALTLSSVSDPVTGVATRQHAYSGSASYRLTPLTSVSFSGERRMVFGNSLGQATDLRSVVLGFTSQLGRQLTGQINARYTDFNSTLTPYRETALSGSLNLRF